MTAPTKSNEWNFTANVAAAMTRLLALDEFQPTSLGRAEAELSMARGPKRPDLILFDREDETRVVVSGELKMPWTAEGRTPFDADLVTGAHAKAVQLGAQYFITWNVKRAVVWKTDDPGVPLQERVIYDRDIVTSPLRSVKDLTTTSFKQTFDKALQQFTKDLVDIVAGRRADAYLPLDRLFVARLEALLDHIGDKLLGPFMEKAQRRPSFRTQIEIWMRTQSWVVSDKTWEENAARAVRFSSYVLLNRLCFYNALRRKYSALPALRVSNAYRTGEQLRKKLLDSFDKARLVTGDYQTVFDESRADDIPFITNDCVPDWRSVITSLDKYDFAHIDLEVIGALYERLIRPEERHRFGQHYTQPTVVDFINAFSVRSADDVILDPSCGGGTFLVRAYNRKQFLDPSLTHDELLTTIYGCDILDFACHLSVINLAVRDLIDDDNFPRIHLGDYLDVEPAQTFCTHPVALAVGGLEFGQHTITLNSLSVDAVVGNPPYISSKLLSKEQRRKYLSRFTARYGSYSWDGSSDILVWFFVHSLQFLVLGGRLSLITQAAWLDVEYGFPLQSWILDHFKIIAVVESDSEPWFTDARVATVVVILQESSVPNERDENAVRFVQFKKPLATLMPCALESERHAAADALRTELLAHCNSETNDEYRIRLVTQHQLRIEGARGNGTYAGGRWGRHLRALDSLYELQRRHAASFCELGAIASVERGTTTNCDSFFIVRNVTESELSRLREREVFRSTYGVARRRVIDGTYAIVERVDGSRFALEQSCLRPILKTARDVFQRVTSAVDNDHFAVMITAQRNALSVLQERYVASGERERWHLGISFGGKADWYKLGAIAAAEIYFVKSVQYAPQLLWNDNGILPNQRLYSINATADVAPELLAAALNSTIFVAERFTSAKALGREAVNDIEVFTARKLLTFDVRNLGEREAIRMRAAFQRLSAKAVKPILEEGLSDAGLATAHAHVAVTPMTIETLPAELKDLDRREIDKIILSALGYAPEEASVWLDKLYIELSLYQRKARLLELSAQVNRRGATSAGRVTVAMIADEVLGELIEAGLVLKRVPDEFWPSEVRTRSVVLPTAGRATLEADSLFSGGRVAISFGKAGRVEFKSDAQRQLAFALAALHLRGAIALPIDDAVCSTANLKIKTYIDGLLAVLRERVSLVSDDVNFQAKIVEEALGLALTRVG